MNINEPTHDDLVSFARLMTQVAWRWSIEPAERMLEYFESPHKWDGEYAKWQELGGTLDKAVCGDFERWYDNKDLPVDDDEDDGNQ